MSPEQASGGDVDHRADLFAAGVVLYEMLVGMHPFRQKSEVATLQAIKAGRYQAPTFANPDVPFSLEVVLDQALSRDPDKRFQSATAFKNALDKFFHDAGFIFSHSTLAAFLKGLFPQASRGNTKRSPSPLQDQDTIPLEPGMLFDDQDLLDLSAHDGEERPTVVSGDNTQDHSGFTESGELSALMRRSASMDHTSHFGPAPSPPDEATVIRKVPKGHHSLPPNPATFEDKTLRPTAIPPEGDPDGVASLADDLATQVMDDMPVILEQNPAVVDRTQTHVGLPDLKARLSGNGGSSPRVGQELETDSTWAAVQLPPRPDRPSDGSPTLERPAIPDRSRGEPSVTRSRPKVASARRPDSARRTYKFLAIFFLCGGMVGTMMGFFLGLLVAQSRAADSHVLPVPAVAQFPPRLQVFAPDGAVLLVDGVQVMLSQEPPTVLTLTAGRPARVRVELEGHLPYESSFNLQANDLQVLHLDLSSLDVRER
jgi:hypothetical protein